MSYKKNNGTDSSYLWMGYSDLMAGLFLSFILVFTAMQKKQEEKNKKFQKMKSQIEQMSSLESQLKQSKQMDSLVSGLKEELIDIVDALKKRKTCVNVEFEASGLTIKAYSKTSENFWFESGSSDLLSSGTDCLKEVSDIWISRLYQSDSYSSKIKQITIDGHTNSLAIRNKKSALYDVDPFVSNMRLSQSRASNAAEVILKQTAKDQGIQKWLRTKITANGRSYGNLIYNKSTGKEDLFKSIRVEFSITLLKPEGGSIDG